MSGAQLPLIDEAPGDDPDGDRIAPGESAAAGLSYPVGLRGELREIGDNLFYGVVAPEYLGAKAACVAVAYCAALRELGLEATGADADWLHEAIRNKYERKARRSFLQKTTMGVETLASMKGAQLRWLGAARVRAEGGSPVRTDIWDLAQHLADDGYRVGVFNVPGHLMAYRIVPGGGIAVIDNGGWEARLSRWRGDKVERALGVMLVRAGDPR